MAYRYEKEPSGVRALVIDGWEKGIADSPFTGIGNIKNLNTKYYPGVAYVNYKRQASTFATASFGIPGYVVQSPAGLIYASDDANRIWKQTAVNGQTFDILSGNTNQPVSGLAYWNNYLLNFANNGIIEICGDGGGDSGITAGAWNTASGSSGVWPIKRSVS